MLSERSIVSGTTLHMASSVLASFAVCAIMCPFDTVSVRFVVGVMMMMMTMTMMIAFYVNYYRCFSCGLPVSNRARLFNQPATSAASGQYYSGFADCLRKIYAIEGIAGYYKVCGVWCGCMYENISK
jgi:hypothetical protein